MKKLVSKFLAALSTIIGYAFLMAHCVYADIALPPEPSKEDSAIVVIVLVVVVILFAVFAFTAKGFNKKGEFKGSVEGMPEELATEGKTEEENKTEE